MMDVGLYAFQLILLGLHGMVQVAAVFQVDPKPFGGAEKLGQPQGGARGYSPFPVHDFIDPLVRYMHGLGEIPLGNRHGHKEFLPQYFARMG